MGTPAALERAVEARVQRWRARCSGRRVGWAAPGSGRLPGRPGWLVGGGETPRQAQVQGLSRVVAPPAAACSRGLNCNGTGRTLWGRGSPGTRLWGRWPGRRRGGGWCCMRRRQAHLHPWGAPRQSLHPRMRMRMWGGGSLPGGVWARGPCLGPCRSWAAGGAGVGGQQVGG